MWHWTNDGRGFKSHSDQLSIATSKNLSVVTTICIVSSFRYTHVIYSIEMDVSTDEFNSRNLTLNKRWNLSRCAKLALRAIWTHGLIAQVVRASERNSVVLDWNPTQAEFLFTATSKNPSVANAIYIYVSTLQYLLWLGLLSRWNKLAFYFY